MYAGYHWQMDGRSQESQEAGQHRDAQGKLQFPFYLLCNAFLRKKRNDIPFLHDIMEPYVKLFFFLFEN